MKCVVLTTLLVVLVGGEPDKGWWVVKDRDEKATASAMRAFKHGMSAFNEGDHEKALSMFSKVITNAPEVADGWRNAGVILEAVGRRDDALRVYLKGTETRSCPECNAKLYTAACNVILAEVESGGKTQHNTIQICEKAVKAEDDDTPPQVMFNMGLALSQGLRYKEAVGWFREGLEKSPRDVNGMLNLANTLLRAGDPHTALSILRTMLDGDEQPPDIHTLIATALSTSEPHSTQAIHHATHAITHHLRSLSLTLNPHPPTTIHTYTSSTSYGHQLHPFTVGNPLQDDTPKTIFTEKTVRVVSYPQGAGLMGKSGIVINGRTVYLPDHAHNARIIEEVKGDHVKVRHEYKVASAVQLKTTNHYHWVVEGLARVWILVKSGVFKADRGVKLLIPSDNNLVEESLRLLLDDNSIPNLQPWAPSLNELHIYTGIYSVLHEAVSDDWFKTDPWYTYFPAGWVVREVGDTIQRKITRDDDEKYILYVSRANAAARGVTAEDENELIAAIEARLAHKVIVFTPSRYPTLASQFVVFASASLILAPHGAGISNIMACTPPTPLVLLPMNPPVDNVWGYLTATLGHPLWVTPTATAFYYSSYKLSAVEDIVDTVAAALEGVSTL